MDSVRNILYFSLKQVICTVDDVIWEPPYKTGIRAKYDIAMENWNAAIKEENKALQTLAKRVWMQTKRHLIILSSKCQEENLLENIGLSMFHLLNRLRDPAITPSCKQNVKIGTIKEDFTWCHKGHCLSYLNKTVTATSTICFLLQPIQATWIECKYYGPLHN